MRPLTYYVGSSLDGFISGPGGEIEHYPVSEDHLAQMVEEHPEVLPAHVRRAVGADDRPNVRFDTVVMGWDTYRPALEAGIGNPYPHLRQVVASRTRTPSDPAVEHTADALRTVRELKAQDGLGVYLAGGGRLAASLADEIDELVVKVYPVVQGRGVAAFGGPFHPRAFTLTGSRTFDSGAVVLSYVRRG
ncbi:dihydrofolate reductase family protein [Kineococcus sp. SYSU DK001]|uniref:dihydrofolate reductase family protein n=1 Tax=Kineococcus sp. SYSU DK001 TaxID=3383122 RepID=UPI003D7C84E8